MTMAEGGWSVKLSRAFREEKKVRFPKGKKAKTEIHYEDKETFVDDGVPMEPFNLKQEREEGYFDADGNYFEYIKRRIADAWLDSIEAEEVQCSIPIAAPNKKIPFRFPKKQKKKNQKRKKMFADEDGSAATINPAASDTNDAAASNSANHQASDSDDHVYDETSGYYYIKSLGYYYDPSSRLYCYASTGQWYSFDGIRFPCRPFNMQSDAYKKCQQQEAATASAVSSS